MKSLLFVAETAAGAVAQIREQLGPGAVVLNVRQVPPIGMARLWQKPRVEVLASLPEPAAAQAARVEAVQRQIAERRRQLRLQAGSRVPPDELRPSRFASPSPALGQALDLVAGGEVEAVDSPAPSRPPGAGGKWEIGARLEAAGVLPLHTHRLVELLRGRHGDRPPPPPTEQWRLAHAALAQLWEQKARGQDRLDTAVHVFVGPPGSGKTVALCKWLAQAALRGKQPARVWRLDAQTANTAESLGVFCEVLGVPLERASHPKAEVSENETVFVDFPGVPAWDKPALEDLAGRVQKLPSPTVHLVLNAAYETSILLAQARAYAVLPIRDLVVTHLDEEPRGGKLWNLLLGTNYTLRYLSSGQNIPGEFVPATPEALWNRLIP